MAALTLTTEVYRNKVSGGWLGKSAGVTLGAASRGQKTPGRINYYSPVPMQPAASAAIDFPLVWLQTLEKAGPDVTTEDLAVAWLEHLGYFQDEYGYAVMNLRRGLQPPASGAFSNWFHHASGGVIRADFWGLVAPGAPQMAAAYAYNDSKLDHSEEGIWAAMFLAAVTSASFFLSDPLVLLTVGLAMMPRTCRTARAIKTVIAAAQRGASWLEARESVQHEVGHPNYSDAPQNMGFFTIGLMYGSGDFARTVCAGVNCGYDTEMVGGALGAVMGIRRGAPGLPEDWTRPLGDRVVPSVHLKDFDTPSALSEVADRTFEIGKSIVAARCPDVEVVERDGREAAEAPSVLTTEPPIAPSAAEEGAHAPVGPPETTAAALAPPPDCADPAGAIAPATPISAVSTAAEPPQPVETATQLTVADAESQSAPVASNIPPDLSAMAPEPETESALNTASADQSVGRIPHMVDRQPVSEVVSPLEDLRNPPPPAPHTGMSVTPDVTGAIAWADSTLIKPLLVTPSSSVVGSAGPFRVAMDTGDTPTIAFGQPKSVSFHVANVGDEAFTGRISLLAPAGWQVSAPAGVGGRQFIAPNSGAFRLEFTLMVSPDQGRIDVANTLTLRLSPENDGPSADVEFLLIGSSCWWVTGPFANFDGEGFDRVYAPEDRTGLSETYANRMLQSVGWEKRSFPECVMDLEPLFKSGSGVVYGQSIINSPTAQEARIVANTNCGVKLWMSGTLVLRRHSREIFRPSLGDGPWAADISLRAGKNPILVKWVRGIEPYQFSLTVSDRIGHGLAEVGNTSW